MSGTSFSYTLHIPLFMCSVWTMFASTAPIPIASQTQQMFEPIRQACTKRRLRSTLASVIGIALQAASGTWINQTSVYRVYHKNSKILPFPFCCYHQLGEGQRAFWDALVKKPQQFSMRSPVLAVFHLVEVEPCRVV